MKPLFKQNILVDFKNLVYRAHLSAKNEELTTSTGKPSGHVLRFVTMVQNIQKLGGDLYFCLEGGETRRYALLPEYKGNRTKQDFDPVPDALRIIQNLKCTIVTPENAEADDAIATLVATSKIRSYIVSGDRDLWALLGPKVRVLSDGEEVTDQKVLQKFGVPARSIPLAKTLCGDPSDCIPRIPGLRWSTVLPVVKECTTPDELYQRLDEVPVKMKKLLEEFRHTVYRLYEVVKLRQDCTLKLDQRPGDLATLTSIVVGEFECVSLQKQLASL